MRTHAFKTHVDLALGGGLAMRSGLCLVYRVTGPDTVEIDRVVVNGGDEPSLWILRHIEADAGLIADMVAKAADDVAWDESRAASASLQEAA